MTQEEKDEYIEYAKLIIPNLESRLSNERDCIADLLKSEMELKKRVAQLEHQLDNATQDAAQSDVDSIRALHERNELRAENETLVKRLADIAAVNVTQEFRIIDLGKEIAGLRNENDSKFSAMCRLREEIADIKKLHADKQTRVMELEFENRALRDEIDALVDELRETRECADF